MATLNKKLNNNEIDLLERKHSDDLKKIYEIYSLLRDYYYLHKKNNKSDIEIGKILSETFQEVYDKNIKDIHEAFIRIKKIYKLRFVEKPDDNRYHKIILGAIKENICYIGRIKEMLKQIVQFKKIDMLKEEINVLE